MGLKPLTPDFRDLLRLLSEHEVEYLVVGGYALSYYGYVRYTKDLDIWIAINPENAQRAAKAIEAFADSSVVPEKLLSERTVLQIGVEPRRVEIITDIAGVTFDECYARRQCAMVAGISINVIDLADLRRNKAASGRPQDLADLDNLPEV